MVQHRRGEVGRLLVARFRRPGTDRVLHDREREDPVHDGLAQGGKARTALLLTGTRPAVRGLGQPPQGQPDETGHQQPQRDQADGCRGHQAHRTGGVRLVARMTERDPDRDAADDHVEHAAGGEPGAAQQSQVTAPGRPPARVPGAPASAPC